MEDEFQPQIYDRVQAQKIARDYLCSRCWGPLLMTFDRDPDQTEIKCTRDESHYGLVSKSFVERQRSTDHSNAVEAKFNLRQMGVIPKLASNEEELLSDLGF